jgi:hypothetical protein
MLLLFPSLFSAESTLSAGGRPNPDRTLVDALLADSLREASTFDISKGGVEEFVLWRDVAW